jgi:hypothetical protein
VQKEIAEALVRRLLEKSRLSDCEVVDRLERARSISYWKSLNPNLSLGGAPADGTIQATLLQPQVHEGLLDRYARDGYVLLDSLLCDPVIDRLRVCVETLRNTNWPPVFAFVYDQAWLVTRAAPIGQLLAGILGPGYRQASDVWVHFVPAHRGSAGWPPHQDYPGRHRLLTVWIALGNATAANGCLCVLPKDQMPRRIMDNWQNLKMFERSDLERLLQISRALTAPKGSALILDSEVIHWGATCTQGGEPRISLAVEFLAAETEPVACEIPLLDVQGSLPTFAERLRLIGKCILTYQKRSREPWMIRYADLASQLREEGD